MPLYNPAQAQYFIDLLTENDDSILTFQIYYDPKDGTERKDLAKWFNAPLKDCHAAFEQAEINKCGVYVCLNEMDGHGRYGYNTKRVRALFADFDGIDEPNWPLTPHFVSKRDDTHGHAFWLVNDVDVDQFMYLQMRIAISCGTDEQVIDPSRVVRLPGTAHLKDPANPKTYNIAWDNRSVIGDKKYGYNDICAKFELTGDKLHKYEKWVSSRESMDDGAGFIEDPTYVKKYISYLTNVAQPAIEGEGGTYQLIRVANFGRDYGIALDKCQELMWTHYNQRCEPSWNDSERDHFNAVVGRAYKYARNAPGCRTAVAIFDEIPPPPPPKLVQEVIRHGDRLSKDSASILTPQMTAKSSHYELAQCFDGVIYSGVNLIRHKKIYYVFNGRSWSTVDDEIIKSSIQRFYSRFKPSNSLISGIHESLKDLVTFTRKELEDGTWLNTGEAVPGILCFKNGLVDVSKPVPVIMEHTPNYFTFNELEHDYIVGAKCPKFLAFLKSIWPDDPALITQLQQWMGYCLVSDVSYQKMALFEGKSRGGKGVLADIISKMIGDSNTVAPTLGKIMDNSVLSKMSKARLALIPDAHSVHASKRDDVLSGIKAMTGGDPITYDVKFKDAQTTKFKIKIILSTNDMPEFIDASGALVNRMLVFPFRISFEGRENPNLRSELIAEISGITQWALEGLRELNNNGYFTESEASKLEKENLKDDMNPIGRFITDVCELSYDGFTVVESLYDVYLLWCKQHKIHSPMSQNKLTRLLKSTNLPIAQDRRRIDGKRRVGFSGISVAPSFNIN